MSSCGSDYSSGSSGGGYGRRLQDGYGSSGYSAPSGSSSGYSAPSPPSYGGKKKAQVCTVGCSGWAKAASVGVDPSRCVPLAWPRVNTSDLHLPHVSCCRSS